MATNGNGTATQEQLCVRLPAGLHKRVKRHCVSRGEKLQDFVAAALSHRLNLSQAASRTRAAA